jgi:hypothetical protein
VTEKNKSVSKVEKMVKGTHGLEADSWIGIDSACSLLKGNGRTLGNLECQTETERHGHKEKRTRYEAHGDSKIEQGHTR